MRKKSVEKILVERVKKVLLCRDEQNTKEKWRGKEEEENRTCGVNKENQQPRKKRPQKEQKQKENILSIKLIIPLLYRIN